MGITSELRAFVGAMDKTRPYEAERLCKVADRIDVEHERILRETGEDIVADVRREWVRLPVDEDGAPIRIGDVMRLGSVERDLTVLGFGVPEVGDDEYGVFAYDRDDYVWYNASFLRHHHAPTVEDVLREFADEMNQNLGMYTGEAIDADEWRSADNKTIAEYAAKLQLKEDE